MGSRYGIAGAFALVLAAAAAPQAMAEDLVIAGSTTVSSTVLQPFEAKIEKLAKTTYELRSVGSGNGVLALIAGEADMAAVSAPLADVVRKLNTKNPGSVNGRELVAQVNRRQLEEIAELKMVDLNANDVDAAVKILAGSARSMGIEIEG